MRCSRLFLPLLVTAAAVALAGCTSSDLPVGGGGDDAKKPKVREVEASTLPPLGDYSPTSDLVVEAAGPQDWKRLERRDDEYLIAWYGGSSPNRLPRIFVRVKDWTGQADTTPDNLLELRAEIAKTLEANQADILEPPQAMVLAGEPWVRHVEEARIGNAKAERQILNRVVGGKLYIVELQIYTLKILESRDQAYAVAAGLKFDASAGSSSESSGPWSEDAAEPPAAEDPPSGAGANSPDKTP